MSLNKRQSDTKKIVPQKKKKASSKDIFKDRKYFYAIGRRKNSTATLRLYPEGKGRFYINTLEFRRYLGYFAYAKITMKPLELLKLKQIFDASIKVKGGGKSAQADAIQLAFARALIKFDKELKPKLKQAKFLTRDSRKKERKKPGLKRARRAPQWQKR